MSFYRIQRIREQYVKTGRLIVVRHILGTAIHTRTRTRTHPKILHTQHSYTFTHIHVTDKQVVMPLFLEVLSMNRFSFNK